MINISLSLEALQDQEAPKISQQGPNVLITDNVGLFSIQTVNKTYDFYGQNRSVLLKNVFTPQIIRVEDLAGNSTIYTVTLSSKGLDANSLFFIVFIVLGVKRKKR